MQTAIEKNGKDELLKEIIKKSNNGKEAVNLNEILKAEKRGSSASSKLIYKK